MLSNIISFFKNRFIECVFIHEKISYECIFTNKEKLGASELNEHTLKGDINV